VSLAFDARGGSSRLGPGTRPESNSSLLAVIGMAGRFPGARTVGEFWNNLLKGVDSITRFPGSPGDYPDYVPALGILADADEFDAGFFGFSPGEALILDPQQRLFLECAWEALEAAGYDPMGCRLPVGVYAGSSQTRYFQTLLAHRDQLGPVSEWQLRLATGIDFLTGRTSHRLGLTGPAVTVQTACSTSLVAIHLAAQALLSGECDLALAGGAAVDVPFRTADYTPGGIVSRDGHVRAFDANAGGTVGANGVGIVVLKRLSDALADGDHVHAVLRGTAINNDGLDKVGFTAPSVSGQVAVIRDAHQVAEVDPATIGYVEAHGTGTPLGDPIEIAALTRAFRAGTNAISFCRIGSVKTNIGHADAAAGVAGFIKAVLAVEHGLIPASLHHNEPNPEIDFGQTPFTVNTELHTWQPRDDPRRAAVSSFGLGGTNAHAVLEEPPSCADVAERAGTAQLLVLSARTQPELTATTARLAEHLQRHADTPLPDVAWTLQAGRHPFDHRAFVVAQSTADAVRALLDGPSAARAAAGPGEIVFLFPGQGSQHIGMGKQLYEHDPAFRARLDECCALLEPRLGLDLRTVLYPETDKQRAMAARAFTDMGVAQPAVFAVEYALARMWMDWGVRPGAVVGHSLGAFAAACIAGVLSLADALRLVTERGRLLQSLPAGAMLAVACQEAELTDVLAGGVELAVVNGPSQCVLSGPAAAVETARSTLAARGADTRLLHIGAAAHSGQVEPILDRYAAEVAALDPRPPALPWVSETTGDWVPAWHAPGVKFWTRHMRQPVRFGAALETLFASQDRILLEVGPGRTLTTLALRHPDRGERHLIVPSLPHPADDSSAEAAALTAAGRMWQSGVPIDWQRLHDGTTVRRTPLPTYPFNRRRYSPETVSGPAGIASRPSPQAPRTLPPAVRQGTPGTGGNMEASVAQVFAAVLGLPHVAPDDNFFELGGDSLIAVQLIAGLRQAVGADLTVIQVFRAPTPAQLTRLIPPAPGENPQ
jgi:phthiocerol/phenolphthiocerol synthesis type-I polyketide synthase E